MSSYEFTSRSKIIEGIDETGLLASTDPIVQSLDARLIFDYWRWNSSEITYSFNVVIPQDYLDNAINTQGWKIVSDDIKAVTRQIFEGANSLLAVNLTYVDHDGDIRINAIDTTGLGENGHAYYPGSGGISGDIFLNSEMTVGASDNNANLSEGGFGYATIIHELGHALGLKHPFEDGYELPISQDHSAHSIMSYTNYKPWKLVFSAETLDNQTRVSMQSSSVSPTSFMVYDIAALQAIYGTNLTTSTSNDVYQFNGEAFYKSIWDAGGEDTLDFSLISNKNIIRLTGGSYSDINFISIDEQIQKQQLIYQTDLSTDYFDAFVANSYNNNASKVYTGENALGIAYGVVIENVIGGRASDFFYDNSVDNQLSGNDGDDWFYLGAGGLDTINGGDGHDTLVVNLNQRDVQFTLDESGVRMMIADSFAVKFSELEQIQFADASYDLSLPLPIALLPPVKYFVSGSANNYVEFDMNYAGLSLLGSQIQYTGASGVESVYVAKGVGIDFTKASGGVDKLYFAGKASDYSTSYQGTTIQLTENSTGAMIKVAAGSNLSYDRLIFKDGAVQSYNLMNAIKANSQATLDNSLFTPSKAELYTSLGTQTSNIIKAFATSSEGAVFATTPKAGTAMQITGAAGVDKVYIAAGSNIDVTKLSGGIDLVYFTGKLTDYTSSISGTTLTLNRNLADGDESIKVSAGNSLAYEKLIFADGALKSVDLYNSVKNNIALPTLDSTTKTPGLELTASNATQLMDSINQQSELIDLTQFTPVKSETTPVPVTPDSTTDATIVTDINLVGIQDWQTHYAAANSAWVI